MFGLQVLCSRNFCAVANHIPGVAGASETWTEMLAKKATTIIVLPTFWQAGKSRISLSFPQDLLIQI